MLNKSIIGLHAEFAGADNIDKFERFIYQGKATGDFSQLSLEQSVNKAIKQLAWQSDWAKHELPFVLLTEQISAGEQQRLSAQFNLVAVVSSLADCQAYLQQYDVLAIVAVSLNQQAQLPEINTFSLDISFTQASAAVGVAALLFANTKSCLQQDTYRYADLLAFTSDKQAEVVIKQALQQAQISSSDIGYLEITASNEVNKKQQELAALQQAYSSDKRLHTALGSVSSVVGAYSCFSQLAGLLKTVLALQQRYLPATADWQDTADDLSQSPFYIPVQSSHWFNQHSTSIAAFNCQQENSFSHIVLAENAEDTLRCNGYLAHSDLVLIPLSANSEAALLKQLQQLKQEVGQLDFKEQGLRELATQAYQQLQSENAYRLCLLAESVEELLKEINLAGQGIAKAFKELSDFRTPKGSYFSAAPLNNNEGISFLYPGIGATYVGLGRELFHLFPEIVQPVSDLADDIAASLKDTILNPRSIKRLDFHAIKAIDYDLRNNLADIAECGVGYACIFTKIFEQVFQVKADFSTGYSMGEISMYAALGSWEKPGQMSRRLAESDTFNYRLTGELHSLREHWGLDSNSIKPDERLWETYTLKGTLEEFEQAAAGEDKVYCTIINTPDSIVIGGEPEACQRVIKNLGVRAMALDMANAIHSPPAQREYPNMVELYTMDVPQRVATQMYSSSCYLPIPQRTKAIANSIAKCLCDPVDFPRLINTMYDKGARVFIEMGPGRSLCSWVEKILKHEGDKPHISVPVNAKGTSDELTLLRAIAKLLSHGVQLDISRLYYGSLLQPKACDSRWKKCSSDY